MDTMAIWHLNKRKDSAFFVDVEITTDLTKAGQSDQLEDSINYVEVYELVESVMTGEKHNLLERLGALIADSLYQHYQGIVGLSVTVRKPSVPIAGILDYVEVVTTRGQIWCIPITSV